MTPTDHPNEQPMTRRQLREIRLTGQTPVIDPNAVESPAEEPMAIVEPEPAIVPAAPPVTTQVPEAPAEPFDDQDRPRTRREAREIERARTAGIDIIQPEDASEGAASAGGPATTPEAETEQSSYATPTPAGSASGAVPDADGADDVVPVLEPAPEELVESARETPVYVMPDASAKDKDAPDVHAGLGAAVLEDPTLIAPKESFEELITQDESGGGSSTVASHSLILPNMPIAPLTAPVTSSGETLVTGTFNLPETFGASGHAPGTTDGRDVDSVLLDKELPPASSPTPIAATAAVSQAKTPGEVIQPPRPEKSNTLMITLAITAGVLALALTGVIVFALYTGALGQ